MKKTKQTFLTLAILFFSTANVQSQTETHGLGFTTGASINHYNGNLGSSFFQFNTTSFAGISTSVDFYLNKSFDINWDNSIGRFGYCPTEEDELRTAAFNLRCPGESCANFIGMGNLRSQIISSSLSLRYKFGNIFLPESSPLQPYIKAGVGYVHLSDVMKRNCVNAGSHFTVNGGLGLRYNITPRFNINYNLDIQCFTGKKVYLVEEVGPSLDDHHSDGHNHDHSHEEVGGVSSASQAEVDAMLNRKDFCLRNGISFGFNF